MDWKDIQTQCREDSQRWFPGVDNLPYQVLAMCGEAGELANVLKKYIRANQEIGPEQIVDLANETIDVVIYCMGILNTLGVWGDEVYKSKRQFNEERFGNGNSTDQSGELSADSSTQSDSSSPGTFVGQSDLSGFLSQD